MRSVLLSFGAALAGAAVVAACRDEAADLVEPLAAYLVQGNLGPRSQTVTVQRDGAPTTDAEVTVNGVTLPHASNGNYSGELSEDLTGGATLVLEVRAGGSTVTGTGTLPGRTELISPSDGAVLRPPDPIQVEWTSPADATRFVVVATPASGPALEFSAPGTARSLTIDAGVLPQDQAIRLEVVGYSAGSFTGQFGAGSVMDIRGLGTPSTIRITPEPAPRALLVQGSDMGARFQNVRVAREGAPVQDATVTVNGTPLTHLGNGSYNVQLSETVLPGGTLTLEVEADESAVTAIGAVPEAPVVTAPGHTENFDPADPIGVEWTSSTDPDRFAVIAVCGAGCASQRFTAPGAARSLTIPAGALPNETPIEIRVFAYNDGSYSGHFEPSSAMSIRGEGGPFPTITIGTTTIPRDLLVQGSDMGPVFQNLRVFRAGAAVTDATVTVNGVALSHISNGFYRVALSPGVPAGGTLALEVDAEETSVTANGLVPGTPLLTAPADGATIPAATPIVVEWTSPSSPDRFRVSGSFSCGPGCGTARDFTAAGTDRTLTIPAGALPSGEPIQIRVFAYNDGDFSGDFQEGSTMNIRTDSQSATVTISP